MTNTQVAQLVIEEVERAETKHPIWRGVRYGHSVIEEEYEEFKQAVFADNDHQTFMEITQLAAMCLRYMKNHAPSSVRLFH